MKLQKKIAAFLLIALLGFPHPGMFLLAEELSTPSEVVQEETPVVDETPVQDETPVVEEQQVVEEQNTEQEQQPIVEEETTPEQVSEESANEEEATTQVSEEETAPEGEDGSAGDNGESGDAEEEVVPVSTGGDIVTGDAGAISDTENQANTNAVNTGSYLATSAPTTTPEENSQEEGSQTEDPDGAPNLQNAGDQGTASTTIENVADVENTGTTTAETGGNVASGTGTSTITTGNALAVSNIINVVNSNIINSYGFLLFLNMLFGSGAIDLSQIDWDSFRAGGQSACDLGGCSDASFNANVTNDANIDNSVVVRADTGGNTVEGGSGSISTGDAYAAANIVNVANTNIVDSNYLLIALNNFGDLNGDIILPNVDFFDWFLNGFGLTVPGSLSINNDATVNNNVTTVADTGSNEAASTDGQASITTGNAGSASGVSNIVNSNLVGGSQVYILLRVFGNWSGDIFNLPPGLSWSRTSEGIAIYSDPTLAGAGGLSGGDFNFSNHATVNNDVEVYALTGDNHVDTEGDATITTGDALSAANIINLVNTTVIGRNLLFAAFNIMGNWNGNLSFGQPDLFVGGRATLGDEELRPGSPITYYLTVTNLGNVRASNVTLKNLIEEDRLEFIDPAANFSLGTLEPHESKDVQFRARVSEDIPYGETPVTLNSTATSREGDANPNDNTEEITFMAYNSPHAVSYIQTQTATNNTAAPSLEITKTSSVSTTTIPGAVDYVIAIDNHGGSAYNALLVDTMRDQNGTPVKEHSWDLGEIMPGEHIEVKYTMTFAAGMVPGLYTNEAQIFASATQSSGGGGGVSGSANSNISHVSLAVVGPYTPLVGPSCGKYLTKYMRMGGGNDPKEVTKLQEFLKNSEHFDSVKVTGFFDKATLDAVKAFQTRYADEILSPWGIKGSTGYVYYTTQRKINELYCNGLIPFVLNPDQISEIQSYRSRVDRSIQQGLPLPSTDEVGQTPTPNPSEPILAESSVTSSQVASALSAVQESVDTTQEALKASLREWISRSVDRLRRQTSSIFDEIFSIPSRMKEEAFHRP